MAFKKIVPNEYPIRQWALLGAPTAGKSTFASRMRGPLLVVDSDHRFSETSKKWGIEAYALSDDPADNTDPDRIALLLKANMRGSGIKTVVFDSLTSFLTPYVLTAIADNASGKNTNKVASFKDKALAMRTVQFALTNTGVDCLWIYHTRQVRNAKAQEVETTSVSAVELARLRSSLNMTLKMIVEGERRGIIIEWAREGRSGITLWDEVGGWEGMPERIEAAVYDGLSEEEKAELANRVPTTFAGPEEAIAWGYDQGVFNDAVHAKNGYEKLKEEKKPKNAQAMWDFWIEYVEAKAKPAHSFADEPDEEIPFDAVDDELAEEAEEAIPV